MLKNLLDQTDKSWSDYSIKIVDSPLSIGMAEEPVSAVRRKRRSSLVMAVESVGRGECSAVLSAGNSGAAMAASLFFIGREYGIDRPALVGFIPAMKEPVVCLDLGANVDCRPSHLLQFAHLGLKYANIDAQGRALVPTVGLLSNGEEASKGSALTKEAFKLLKNSKLNFVGNVEPYQIVENKVDIVVCDGFSGNILLKTIESTARICFSVLKDENVSLCLLKKKLCVTGHSGALLAGIKKTAVIVHGSAKEDDIDRAIEFTANTALRIRRKPCDFLKGLER